jgi:hypothetical protein
METLTTKITGIAGSTYVRVETGVPAVGSVNLWMPEGIASDKGFCSIYPLFVLI